MGGGRREERWLLVWLVGALFSPAPDGDGGPGGPGSGGHISSTSRTSRTSSCSSSGGAPEAQRSLPRPGVEEEEETISPFKSSSKREGFITATFSRANVWQRQ